MTASFTGLYDRIAIPSRPEPPLAWCPLCELPRARLHILSIGGIAATVCACECARRMMTVLPDGVRAILMTENHDPGDEDRT